VGKNSGDNLEDHESDDQQQCDRQVAPIGIQADAMRMSTVMMVLMSMAGAMVAVVLDFIAGHLNLVGASERLLCRPTTVDLLSIPEAVTTDRIAGAFLR
jgi:hypothetical protein